ncbi:MAG TPA: FAD-linked oxidase C-terminal domain-containing protein [Streptosporangiaceae bacterium]|nr:FAD-linked oxidase C-terminal domain-containing protein [Streptosporangiaceae bacterium]
MRVITDPAAGEGADLAAALRRVVGGEVRFDPYSRRLFARDASMYAIEPIGVVFPRDAADVAAVVSTAAEFGVPVLPRGAGTSLAGQTVGHAVVMDLSRHMSAIIEVDAERRLARVQPGVVQEQLNLAAAAHGLMFGPDTSTSNRATLGGMIGNNSAGSQSVRYGMTIDHVLALDVVLSDASWSALRPLAGAELAGRAAAPTLDGAICRELPRLVERHREAIATGFPRFWRQSGGYRLDRLDRLAGPDEPGRPGASSRIGGAGGADGLDLAKFVVGSEGTLVTVVEATVALVPAPRFRVIAVGHFTSVPAAIEATGDALACGPAAVEMLDRTILELSRQKIEYRALGSILHGDPEALLFVTFSGDTEAEATAGLDRLDARWRAHGHGYHTLRAVAAGDQAALLKVRQAGLGLLMAASSGTRRPLAFVEDTAVEPAELASYASRFRQILDAHGLTAGFYGHCSVGCLHIRPFVDLSAPGQPELMRAVAEEVRELVLEYGGVNSSEHGDGLARSEFNRRVFGDGLYAAMQETKRLFDPANRMNPGKIVNAPPMTDHLRDAARPPAPPLATRLRFDTPGGMRGAADRCMNIGLCRKGSTGVMCPSYMATRDEEHSTRGRANALLHALSMPDPRAALGDDRLHGILDLCLECKACKSECPLGVDMAALKTETLAAYHDLHGVPLRSRMFGSIRTLNRLGSAAFPLSNLASGWRPARLLAERWLGISAARPLPRFQRHDLRGWFRRRPAPAAAAPQRELIFLADSFTTFTEPSAPRAAIELLELAGWRVRLEDAGCCGRASLSKGLIGPARQMAAGMTGRLGGVAAGGVPITGVEPSCLLTLRDEYAALLPGDPAVPAVAAATRLPEELLLEAAAEGRLSLPRDNPISGRRIVFHGHCHQKALAGTAATVALLRSIPGVQVTEVDAGCCGMAGSFGFEAEHYELSMGIGELRLFPAIRAEPGATIVAATGVSCRQQIAHGTGRPVRHPLEIIWQALQAPGGPPGTAR